MKKLLGLFVAGTAILGGTALSAALTDTVTVTINVVATNDIDFSGNPATFVVSPGSGPDVDNSTTYSVVTNQTNQKVTGALTNPLPAGLTLTVNLEPPPGAFSNGTVALTTSPQNLVTGISTLTANGLGVVYSVTASPSAAIGTTVDTIVYTLSS